MLKVAIVFLFLAGCQSNTIQVSKDDLQSYERYSLPVIAENFESVVYFVQLHDNGKIEPNNPPEYRWVRDVQIGQSERRSFAPGENVIFRIKPGTYKIQVTGVCGKEKNTQLPPAGSEITPDLAGWKKQTTFFGNAFLGSASEETFEAGKVYIYSMSPSCYLNRQAGDIVFLLGMRLRDDQNAKYLVYKTKFVGNK